MKRPLSIDDEALAESIEARDYYATQRPELGRDFADALDRAMTRISEHPQMWPVFSVRTRRYLRDRFPYAVVYRVRPDGAVHVMAVCHQHGRPNYWRLRQDPDERTP